MERKTTDEISIDLDRCLDESVMDLIEFRLKLLENMSAEEIIDFGIFSPH